MLTRYIISLLVLVSPSLWAQTAPATVPIPQTLEQAEAQRQRAETLRWHTDEATGLITLEVENTGVFNTIAQKVFHKPRTTQVHLDETGSYLWPLIDGQKTVAQLADCMKQQFGEKAEPLYPRIIKYFQIVESYHFIKFLNQ